MILLYIILLLLIFLIVYDLVRGIRVNMHAVLNSNTMKMHISALNSLIRVVVDMENGTPYLTVYLLRARLFSVKLARKKASHMCGMAKNIKIENLDVSASYGFNDPFMTAMASGAFGALASLFRINSLVLAPNFMSDEQYALMDASANIKVGHTIWGYLTNKTKGE